MNLIFILFLSAIHSLSANEVVETIYENLQNFDVCTGDQFDPQELTTFQELLKEFEKTGEKGSIEITDDSFAATTLRDNQKQLECTLYVDVYDGRCVYALCHSIN